MQSVVSDLIQECFSLEYVRFPRDLSEQLADEIIRSAPTPRLPCVGESVAIATAAPKVAALCFDRVWAPQQGFPSEIAFFAGSDAEFRL